MQLREKTLPGLHDLVFPEFVRRVAVGARVVDLGAGSGAWARRLAAAGYAVTPVERDRDFYAAKEIPAVFSDLQTDFGVLPELSGQFDAATALEVIEHLENPWHFLRQARRCLRKGGILVLTTPNIECVSGRIRFLLRGELRMFGADPAFNDMTHITPIHSEILKRRAPETGFRMIHHGFNAESPQAGKLLSRLTARALDGVLSGSRGGDNHFFVMEGI